MKCLCRPVQVQLTFLYRAASHVRPFTGKETLAELNVRRPGPARCRQVPCSVRLWRTRSPCTPGWRAGSLRCRACRSCSTPRNLSVRGSTPGKMARPVGNEGWALERGGVRCTYVPTNGKDGTNGITNGKPFVVVFVGVRLN